MEGKWGKKQLLATGYSDSFRRSRLGQLPMAAALAISGSGDVLLRTPVLRNILVHPRFIPPVLARGLVVLEVPRGPSRTPHPGGSFGGFAASLSPAGPV